MGPWRTRIAVPYNSIKPKLVMRKTKKNQKKEAAKEMGRGGRGGRGGGESDAKKRTHPIVTRSMSRSMSPKPKSKPSKTAKSGGIVMPKLYKISVDGSEFYSHMTPAEYVACRKEVEDFLSNPPCKNDPTYDKRQRDWLCHRYFSIIQKTRKEMADFVLVESMPVKSILFFGCWAHMNFKAKHKDVEDSKADIYFAELDVPKEEVTCLTKLDIDLSADTSAYKCCAFCHRDPKDKRELSVGGKFLNVGASICKVNLMMLILGYIQMGEFGRCDTLW